MSSNTTYIPEILNAISEEKNRDKKKVILAENKGNKTLITLLVNTYGPAKSRLTKGDIKRLLKQPYAEPYAPEFDMTWGNLYQGMIGRQITFFLDNGPMVKKTKLEQIFMQLRETLHPQEFDTFVNMLLKKNLAKGLTEKLVRETFPKLLPEKE
jgi:hypothetical protein